MGESHERYVESLLQQRCSLIERKPSIGGKEPDLRATRNQQQFLVECYQIEATEGCESRYSGEDRYHSCGWTIKRRGNHGDVWDHIVRYKHISEANKYGFVLAVRDERCRARRQTAEDMAYGHYVPTITWPEHALTQTEYTRGLFIQLPHLSGLLYTEWFASTNYYLPNPYTVRPVSPAAFPAHLVSREKEE